MTIRNKRRDRKCRLRRGRQRAMRLESLEARRPLATTPLIGVAGDFSGDGIDNVGVYDPSSGQFYLRYENTPGFAHAVFAFPGPKSQNVPLVGDWNRDGVDTVAMYDPQERVLHTKDTNRTVGAVKTFELSSLPVGGAVVVGDFDGDGFAGVGVYEAESGALYVVNDLATGAVETHALWPELASTGDEWTPLAGDFDGDGRDGLALFHRASGELRVRESLDGAAVDEVFCLNANETGIPLAGDFSGAGRDALGFYDQETGAFALSAGLSPEAAVTHTYVVVSSTTEPAPAVQYAALPSEAYNPWHNFFAPTDIDADGAVAPTDALLLINDINVAGARVLPMNRDGEGEAMYLDVDADGFLAPIDALLVINQLIAPPPIPPAVAAPPPSTVLTASEVSTLLSRGAAASASEDAIIAIVDRGGRILGVRVEDDVLATITDDATLVFAIDGAVAKARTAAFFANGDGRAGVGPLTSRTIRFVSQSTVTQRAVESNPNIPDLDSTIRGPGTVAPVGIGGHFPPMVLHTPPVDLFDIENTNRDSVVHPGPDMIKGTMDDIVLDSRFNVDTSFIPMGQEIEAPESYGFTSKRMEEAQGRGIATLPGGIPLYKNGVVVGGIGVFFPGDDGYATHEQGFVAGIGQTAQQRTNAPKVLEAEWIAFAAAGGSSGAGAPVGPLSGIAKPAGFDLPFGRIDLVGITLEIYGPHPTLASPITGVQRLLQKGASVGMGDPTSGANQVVDPGPDMDPDTAGDNLLVRDGKVAPEGWLVLPHAGGDLSAAEVETIVMNAIAEANIVRAGIRLKSNGKPGERTKMVFAVSDKDGNVLGLFRMPDATVFSIDVAVAKARNTAYYADASVLVPADRIDDNGDGIPDASVPAGAALTNRTFRFLAEPRFPSGVDGSLSGAFSIMREPSINPTNAENVGAPAPASSFTTVLGFNTFNPGRNFRDPDNLANQNGIVFFPGSAPLYESSLLVGGLGVSGDGVDQDDVVTVAAAKGFDAPGALRADQFFVRGVRLPYQKFLRNPYG